MWAVLAAFGRLLRPMLAILGRSCASTGGPGPLLEPMLAVLGCSWELCWRSWAALGVYVRDLGASVGGLGPLLGPKLAVLAALGAFEGGLETGSGRKAAQTQKSGPNPSGSRAQRSAGPPNPPEPSEWPGASPHFFYRYMIIIIMTTMYIYIYIISTLPAGKVWGVKNMVNIS